MAEEPTESESDKPSVLTSLTGDQRLADAARGRRRWTASDTMNASQLYENRGFRLLELLAPDNFYRWPMWKKLLLVIPVLVLGFAIMLLRANL
jgi:hypothetical protein